MALQVPGSRTGVRRRQSDDPQRCGRGLNAPFFGALVDDNEEANQLRTCPGHNVGVFESAANRFSGFNGAIQDGAREPGPDGAIRLLTCVAREH
jgi:hypothetical protein